MDIFAAKYKEGFQAPNGDINPRTKSEKDYCVKKAQSLYSLYLNDRCAIFASAYDNLCSIRRYGQGAHEASKYKTFLGGKDGKSADSSLPQDTDGVWNGKSGSSRKESREGWQNMTWDIISIMPKIKANIKGLFSDIEYDIIADNIDADSGAEQEYKKYSLLLKAKDERFITQYKINGGLPIEDEEFLPQTASEADMYAESGGFKTYVSKALEELLKFSFEVSNWDEIKDNILDSLVDFNIAGSRTYYCEETGLVKARFVDPLYAIIQYNKNRDYNGLEFAGELVQYTLLQLKQKGFDETILNKIGYTYNGLYGNR